MLLEEVIANVSDQQERSGVKVFNAIFAGNGPYLLAIICQNQEL